MMTFNGDTPTERTPEKYNRETNSPNNPGGPENLTNAHTAIHLFASGHHNFVEIQEVTQTESEDDIDSAKFREMEEENEHLRKSLKSIAASVFSDKKQPSAPSGSGGFGVKKLGGAGGKLLNIENKPHPTRLKTIPTSPKAHDEAELLHSSLKQKLRSVVGGGRNLRGGDDSLNLSRGGALGATG